MFTAGLNEVAWAQFSSATSGSNTAASNTVIMPSTMQLQNFAQTPKTNTTQQDEAKAALDEASRFQNSAANASSAAPSKLNTTSSSNFRPTVKRTPPTQKRVRGNVNKLNNAPTPYQTTRSNVATLPDPVMQQPTPVRKRSDEDPFAPVGINVGSINLKPSFDVSGGFDSNPLRRSGTNIKSSSLVRTDAEVRVQSDWSLHALSGGLRGSYQSFIDVSGADRPEIDGRLTYRHDFLRDTQGEFEVRGRVDTQRPGSPDLSAAVRDRPAVYNYGSSLGVTQKFNRLSVGLRGSVDRTDYEDASLTNGLTLLQSDRNVTQTGVRIRVGYELTPGITPFVDGQFDKRMRDERIDASGFQRDSTGVTGRVGSTFELSRLLTGEVAVGYQERKSSDARIQDLRGTVADGSLLWAITPLTNVRLTLASSLDETSLISSNGVINQRIGLQITHDLWRNLTIGTSIAFDHADYRGISLKEQTLRLGASADYRISRSWVVRTSFTHERLKSSTTGADYTANIFLAGLRLQR